jgi:ArsR family transcriptional regulator, lead/cadmium/zinc/bismuth-responsive transcriptional repressor
VNRLRAESQVVSSHRRVAQGDMCQIRGADPARVERGQQLLLDDDEYRALAETFQALADPTRAKIVYSLLRQELCTCDLAAIIGSSESAVSQHLRVLRQLRLVKSRRAGKLVFYSLDDAHISLLLAVCLGHVHDVDGAQHARIEPLLAHFSPAAEDEVTA